MPYFMQYHRFSLCLVVGFVFILAVGFCIPEDRTFQQDNGSINYTGLYVAKDTLPSLDKSFKSEITVYLMKFHPNGTVQMSGKYTYNEGEPDQLTNPNIVKWLNPFTSFYFSQKKAKLSIYCSSIHKRKATDFATASKVSVEETFRIKGDTLFRDKKTSRFFPKMYILHKELTFNHPSVRETNACD
ncbi:hypothetical protein [Flavobacterium humi]|uniref:Uncharacterized protein n=1 Tax=Flavobacterium humi TaxID=2562683 RepID=A0A4Z0LAT2_9FLAO|nr:hypothetical protein [Flavobacterium humi]TGD58587.1 hypothetical protein E4635_06650 [Flavobacterium humi]